MLKRIAALFNRAIGRPHAPAKPVRLPYSLVAGRNTFDELVLGTLKVRQTERAAKFLRVPSDEEIATSFCIGNHEKMHQLIREAVQDAECAALVEALNS